MHLAARARVFNAEYRAAIADYAAAREDVAVARAKFLPQAQVDGSLAAGGNNGAADVYGFSVSQRALDLPRAAIKRAAEFETQAAAADLRALWQALAADVAVARLDAHLALENARLVAARERAVREQWESAKARAAAGGGTRKDELEAFARLQGIRADGFSAASDVAVAMSEISRLSGVPIRLCRRCRRRSRRCGGDDRRDCFSGRFQFAASRGGAQAAAANARIARGD